MTIFNAVLLGIVEGLTEFLPISSTAHLILTSELLGIYQTEFTKFFEVFIQSGAILAVVLLYWKLILNHKSYILNLIISFIPTAITGFILYPIIKNVFFNSLPLISISLFTVGILFIVLERNIAQIYLGGIKGWRKGLVLTKTLAHITYNDAFIIGLVQTSAVIPGVSRAGAVIITMLLLGYNRKDSAIYSFLLAIPTIFAASVFDLFKTDWQLILQPNNMANLLMGFLVSFMTAYFVIKWFISYLQKKTLVGFGIYRIILAILLMLFISL